MDIQKNGKTIHIKADDKNNNISVERKNGKTEVTIDGETEVFKGNDKIVIDAGKGNDVIKVSNLPSGKSGAPLVTILSGDGDDYVEAFGNVKVADNSGINTVTTNKNNIVKNIVDSTNEAYINGYIEEINTVLSKKAPSLEIKDKEVILEILTRCKNKGSLPDLANKLDKDKKLVQLYRDMGSLVNQGDVGAGVSAMMMIFTAGISLGVEGHETRAPEMKKLLEESGVDKSILKKLQ